MRGGAIGHVAFDFDGTLVRSNKIKRDCFYETLAGVPGGAGVLDDLFSSRFKGDRFALFAEAARRLAAGGAAVPEAESLAATYGKMVRERIAAAPEVPGAGAALTGLASAGVQMYLISATPEPALRDVVADRGMSGFFDRILGAPTGKAVHLRRVMDAAGISATEIAMVGDGHDDQAAAAEIGCRFIAVTDQPTAPFGEVEVSTPNLHNLRELLGFER
jgi:phosphoglycolate phosphatase-like HAD superfamily hydrolase